MAEVIQDGIGSGYVAQVNSDNRLMVQTEGISIGSISLGSISFDAGSESFNYVSSGTGWIEEPYQREVTISGTIPVSGALNVYQNTSPWITIGSVNIDNAASVGSLNVQKTTGSIVIIDAFGNTITPNNPIPIINAGTHLVEGTGPLSIGSSGTATELVFTGSTTSIIVSSWVENTGMIYVGGSTVSGNGANAMTFLDIGEDITISHNNSGASIYVISDTSGQKVFAGATKWL